MRVFACGLQAKLVSGFRVLGSDAGAQGSQGRKYESEKDSRVLGAWGPKLRLNPAPSNIRKACWV